MLWTSLLYFAWFFLVIVNQLENRSISLVAGSLPPINTLCKLKKILILFLKRLLLRNGAFPFWISPHRKTLRLSDEFFFLIMQIMKEFILTDNLFISCIHLFLSSSIEAASWWTFFVSADRTVKKKGDSRIALRRNIAERSAKLNFNRRQITSPVALMRI